MSSSPWDESASRLESVLVEHFGAVPERASVAFLGVDPIELLRFRLPDRWTYCSLGMARDPMTSADQQVIELAGPRAELMLEVAADQLPVGQRQQAEQVWKSLAVFAAAPAVEGIVYGPGITVDSGRPIVSGSACTGALVVESEIADIPTPEGLVSVLRLLPVTAKELAWARVHGPRALRQRLADEGVDLLDLTRSSVRLRDSRPDWSG